MAKCKAVRVWDADTGDPFFDEGVSEVARHSDEVSQNFPDESFSETQTGTLLLRRGL